MEYKIVGMVTEKEKQEIQILHERKNGLKELLLTLDNPKLSDKEKNELNEKINKDLSDTCLKYEHWWEEKSVKYSWKSIEYAKWSINFQTNEISLAACECTHA